MRLRDRAALVTGAASGIGRAVALELGRAGAAVCVTDVDEAGAEAVAAEVAALTEGEPRKLAGAPAFSRRLDVTREADWEEALDAVVQRWGRLDILVANAGISAASALTETSLEAWRRVTAVNLDGIFLGIRGAAAIMTEAGSGSIVVVGSASGIRAAPGAAAYSASKAALSMLVRSAALELAEQGVRVNAVSPSAVRTPLWRDMPFFRELVEEHGEAGSPSPARSPGSSPSWYPTMRPTSPV